MFPATSLKKKKKITVPAQITERWREKCTAANGKEKGHKVTQSTVWTEYRAVQRKVPGR